MNEETYEALKKLIKTLRKTWRHQPEMFLKTNTSISDVIAIETWIKEVAKEYDDKRYCHLCGSIEIAGGWCSNPSCFEYKRHEN